MLQQHLMAQMLMERSILEEETDRDSAAEPSCDVPNPISTRKPWSTLLWDMPILLVVFQSMLAHVSSIYVGRMEVLSA